MADVATRLRAFLLTVDAVKTPTGGRICETHVAQHLPDPYIRFGQVGQEMLGVINSSVGEEPLFDSIEVQCVSQNESKCKDLTNATRTALHKYRGTFDDTTAKGIFVDSLSVDEETLPDGSNSGWFIGTLATRIFL